MVVIYNRVFKTNRLMQDNILQILPALIQTRTGARAVRILQTARLSGGAIQDNFAVDVEIDGGSMPGHHELVLRTDAPTVVATSLSRLQEYAVLQVACAAGVTAPEPFLSSADWDSSKQFFLMRRVAGKAEGVRIVKQWGGTETGSALAERLGAELAKLHCITPPHPALEFLVQPTSNPARERVNLYRNYLDELDTPRLAVEYALDWLWRNAPDDYDLVLCHSDFRSGNYMVDQGQLTGILDWEFASWSDPLEDLGWFCARSWRFGGWQWEAGGLAGREVFYRGYEQAGGRKIDRDRVFYWEVMAAVRWAVIALQQAERHLSGGQQSIELALTGRMVPEMEFDMLRLIDSLELETV